MHAYHTLTRYLCYLRPRVTLLPKTISQHLSQHSHLAVHPSIHPGADRRSKVQQKKRRGTSHGGKITLLGSATHQRSAASSITRV